MRAYVANCVESSSSCFLGDSVDEGIATIQGFLDDVETDPLPTGDGARPLTLGLAVYGIILPLYQRSLWILLSSAMRAALGGDGAQLLQLADLYAHRNPDGTYADNFMEALPAISCLDDPSGVSPSDVPAEIPAFEAASPTFGRAFAWALVGCRNWPARLDGEADHHRRRRRCADRGHRHHPRPRHPAGRGRRRWPPSLLRASSSPATATATPATTPTTAASTSPSSPTSSKATSRPATCPADL